MPAPAPTAKPAGKGKSRVLILALAAVLVLGGGWFAYQKFIVTEAPPPPVAKKTPAPAPTPATKTASTPAASGPTPSDTLNQIAKAPGDAVQKAKDAINARRESGQSRVDAAAEGSDLPDKPAIAPSSGAPKSATTATTGTRSVAPGFSATTSLDAAAAASPAFRSFVLNAKISGATPARAMINGKLTRLGEIVEPTLGVSWEGYDTEKNQLTFKDRSGAVVHRRYP